jgi:predicted flap endonuclease-1-like 5' DNA nuclease
MDPVTALNQTMIGLTNALKEHNKLLSDNHIQLEALVNQLRLGGISSSAPEEEGSQEEEAPNFFGPAATEDNQAKSDRTKAVAEMRKVSGIGPARAAELVDAGITTIQQLADAKYTEEFIKTCRGRNRAEKMVRNAKAFLKANN